MPAKQCTGTLQMEDMFAQDDNCNIINYNGKKTHVELINILLKSYFCSVTLIFFAVLHSVSVQDIEDHSRKYYIHSKTLSM